MIQRLSLLAFVLLFGGCASQGRGGEGGADTAEEARKFLADVNETMVNLNTAASQAAWTYSTFITTDTEAMNARASQAFIEAVAKYAKDATRFDHVQLSPEERRQMDPLKLSLVLVTPQDPKKA